MKGTIDDFKRAYQAMSDEALLAVNPDELIEAARLCYEEEVASRSLTPQPAPEPAGEFESRAEPVEADGELVCVAYLFPNETPIALGVLESAEIPCIRPGSNMRRIAGFLESNYVGGQRILVPSAYAEQARELLAPMITEANKALVTRWFEEVWNDGHEDRAEDFGAGADPILRSQLSGLHITVDEMIAEADKVAARISITGNPEGAAVRFQGVVIVRIEGGRIVDTWAISDANA
jgi:predicted ester cyclase